MTEAVRFRIDDGIALVTIDRPDTRNAVSSAVIARLGEVLDDVERRADDVRVFAIRGAGDRVFVSGGDLKEMAALRTLDQASAMALAMRGVLDRIAALPMPTIALVNGAAIGGGAEVAVACDIRIAVDTARIGFTQSQLAIMPAWGGIERLVGLVGRARALYLLLGGQPVDAGTALAMGLLDETVPSEHFDARCRELLSVVAGVPGVPRLAIKALVAAVAPAVSPGTSDSAIESFAESWVADEHWTAVAAVTARVRAARPDVADG
jgi:enoyl-CoA hydratase/carnithine racemase